MKILNYFDFILESKSKAQVPVVFSESFKDKLDSIGNSFISSSFKSLYDDIVIKDFTFISVGKSDDTISYVDSNRVQDYINKNNISDVNQFLFKNKEEIKLPTIEIKVGRFINKFFPNTFSDKAIEDFVNKWKSTKEDNSKFEILKGVDIKSAYKSKDYFFTDTNSNTLMNSCMNDEMWLIDFYAYCPSVSILVLKSEDDYILGRALIWKDYMDRTIMDRVYYVFDKDYYRFIRYAKNNGWYYKKENKSGFTYFIKDGKDINLSTKVRVPDVFKFKDDGFPYMDTFYYAQGEWAMNYEPEGTYFKLQDTEGGYEEYVDADYDEYDEN